MHVSGLWEEVARKTQPQGKHNHKENTTQEGTSPDSNYQPQTCWGGCANPSVTMLLECFNTSFIHIAILPYYFRRKCAFSHVGSGSPHRQQETTQIIRQQVLNDGLCSFFTCIHHITTSSRFRGNKMKDQPLWPIHLEINWLTIPLKECWFSQEVDS